MKRNTVCAQKLIGLRSVTAVRQCYVLNYGTVAPQENRLSERLRNSQDRGIIAQRPRSGRPRTNCEDVPRIKIAFYNPKMSLSTSSPGVNLPNCNIRDLIQKSEGVSIQCTFSTVLCQMTIHEGIYLTSSVHTSLLCVRVI